MYVIQKFILHRSLLFETFYFYDSTSRSLKTASWYREFWLIMEDSFNWFQAWLYPTLCTNIQISSARSWGLSMVAEWPHSGRYDMQISLGKKGLINSLGWVLAGISHRKSENTVGTCNGNLAQRDQVLTVMFRQVHILVPVSDICILPNYLGCSKWIPQPYTPLFSL